MATVQQKMPKQIVALVVAIALGTVVLVFGGVMLSSYATTEGGQVTVVRNGGPLDDRQIRQVIQPGSGRTYIGLGSSQHPYPSTGRTYKISSFQTGGEGAGIPVDRVPTSDGVDIDVEGTLYFALNTDEDALQAFDTQYGTRQYLAADGEQRFPWGDEQGWVAFLDQVLRPVISSNIREQITAVRCVDLQSSCALIQNTSLNGEGVTDPGMLDNGAQNNRTLATIQDAINTSLSEDFEVLGGPYFTDVRFTITNIRLPEQAQTAINEAQAAFAGVSEAQARVAQARLDAEANAQRQAGYAACPACAQIDTLAAIPGNVTTFAPGAGFSVTPQAVP